MGNLDELLRRLIAAKVKFVIVGGFAVAAHGASLLTEDIDVCAPLDFTNLKRIVKALAGTAPCLRDRVEDIPLNVERYREGLNNLYLRTKLGYVDFLGEIPEWGNYDRAVKCSSVVATDVGKCRVLDIDALIEIKKKIGRPRDRQAVMLLQAIQEQQRRK